MVFANGPVPMLDPDCGIDGQWLFSAGEIEVAYWPAVVGADRQRQQLSNGGA
jgi:hypothetical protein